MHPIFPSLVRYPVARTVEVAIYLLPAKYDLFDANVAYNVFFTLTRRICISYCNCACSCVAAAVDGPMLSLRERQQQLQCIPFCVTMTARIDSMRNHFDLKEIKNDYRAGLRQSARDRFMPFRVRECPDIAHVGGKLAISNAHRENDKNNWITFGDRVTGEKIDKIRNGQRFPALTQNEE